jgi:hypothetical protein
LLDGAHVIARHQGVMVFAEPLRSALGLRARETEAPGLHIRAEDGVALLERAESTTQMGVRCHTPEHRCREPSRWVRRIAARALNRPCPGWAAATLVGKHTHLGDHGVPVRVGVDAVRGDPPVA